MAMNVGRGGQEEADVLIDINTTPLIDVMLVLLVMLIITIPIQLHSVNLNMPIGNPPPVTDKPVVITVDVDFDGTIFWNGDRVASRDDLEAR
ncbi:MAG: ExbD/TolR family protein, partial [Betaproteobacteria bacterium]